MTLITTDSIFTTAEQTCLQAVASTMIPPDAEIPGAGDEAIFARILALSARQPGPVRNCIAAIETAAHNHYSCGYIALSTDQQIELLQRLRQQSPLLLGVLVSVVAASYYEDDRVLISLGYEPRPPFPLGHTVETGDWSLLDPVRSREPFYRKP